MEDESPSPSPNNQDNSDAALDRQNSVEKRRVTFQLDDRGRRRFEMSEFMDEQKMQQINGWIMAIGDGDCCK